LTIEIGKNSSNTVISVWKAALKAVKIDFTTVCERILDNRGQSFRNKECFDSKCYRPVDDRYEKEAVTERVEFSEKKLYPMKII